jgi:prevent-host-death family protein
MSFQSDDIVPMNQVRASFTELAEQVRRGREKLITRNGESYVALIDARLFEEIVPNLARCPDLGRDFAARAPQSTEGLAALAALRRNAGRDTALREYVTDDYLLLYAVRGDTVFLLSIRHHRQLSFDLRGHWR